MIMKSSDVSTAVAFIINGYLRANQAEVESAALSDCLAAIRREVDDWNENLDRDDRNALSTAAIDVTINGPRTPFNLGSAIKSLAEELCDLNGKDHAIEELYGIVANLKTDPSL